MTRKSCMNCAFLYRDRISNSGVKAKLTMYAHQRQEGQDFNSAACYFDLWTNIHAKPPNEQSSFLSSARKCLNFRFFDPNNTAPLYRLWEEQQQRNQDCKDRRKFIITTTLSLIVAVAVVATAILHLIELMNNNQ